MSTITVNGRPLVVQSPPDTPLPWVLLDELSLTGPKYGCGLAQCGACTVHVGGRATRSCVTPVSAVREPVVTVEGLGIPERPHPVQKAFIDAQAAQSGYCINGMVMTTATFLRTTPKPSDAQIKAALDGNLCRCGTHMRIIAAVKKAAETQLVAEDLDVPVGRITMIMGDTGLCPETRSRATSSRRSRAR
jgi:nicotinate dehydrogenase subunit A